MLLTVLISVELLKKEAAAYSLQPPDRKRPRLLHGVLLMKPDGSLTIEDPEVRILCSKNVSFT
jgi:hypothetical protein